MVFDGGSWDFKVALFFDHTWLWGQFNLELAELTLCSDVPQGQTKIGTYLEQGLRTTTKSRKAS